MAITLLVRSSVRVSEPSSASITLDLPRIVLGRSEGCDLRLPDLSVSHRHASIRQRGSEYILLDEGSTNGTFIGSVRLHAQSPRLLRNGELVRLGRVWLEVRIEQVPAHPQPALATRELALALVAQALDAQGESAGPRLVVTDGPDLGKQLTLDEAMRPYILGRGRECDLALDLTDGSRRHAQVVRRGDTVLLRDLGSKNGTYTDAGAVAADRDATLRVGDCFRIGPDRFVFEYPAQEALKELERASDEPMEEHEAAPPPSSSLGSEHIQQGAERLPRKGIPEACPSPNPEVVPRSVSLSRSAPAPSWSRTDFLIGALAMLILGVSAVGLFWLFRGC